MAYQKRQQRAVRKSTPDWRDSREYNDWAVYGDWDEDEEDEWDTYEDDTWEEYEEAYPVRAGRSRYVPRQRSRSLLSPGLRCMLILVIATLSILLCVLRLTTGSSSHAVSGIDGGSNTEYQRSTQDEDSPASELTDTEKLAVIRSDTSAYPTELQELAEKNAEALDYVYNYPEKKLLSPEIDLHSEAGGSSVPLLIQWDERWGYKTYGSGLMGYTGCGPTCLSMVAIYLTRNAGYDPYTVAQYAEQNGYYVTGSGTSWDLMQEGCASFGLTCEELPLDETKMVNALSQGKPIICAMGPGDFTDAGHYIVLTGHTSGGFTICDPNSPQRSSQVWSYARLESQIRNIWAFSKA